MEKNFQEVYNEFMDKVFNSVVTGEDVGKEIARMAQYFGYANSAFADALTKYNVVARDIEGTEDATGKTISSAKAKVIAAATPESETLIQAKADIESIEQMINALKSLQKGMLVEYSHMGKM